MNWPWPVLEIVVEHGLSGLSEKVRESRPKVETRFGIARSKSQPNVYVLRTFFPEGKGFDPLVVGVSFVPKPEGLRLQADIVGESTGTVFAERDGLAPLPYDAVLMAYDLSHTFDVEVLLRCLANPESEI
jgi:hypothetical protein